jgi:hypothetical protein
MTTTCERQDRDTAIFKHKKADDDGAAVSVEQTKKTTADAGSKGKKADATAPKATSEKKRAS